MTGPKAPPSPSERLRHSIADPRPPIERLNRRIVWVGIGLLTLVMAIFASTLGPRERKPASERDLGLAERRLDRWWEAEADGVVQIPAAASPERKRQPRGPSESLRAAMSSPLLMSPDNEDADPRLGAATRSTNPPVAVVTTARSSATDRYALTAGTVIPAALLTPIQSEIPGPIVAQVTDDIRDTVTSNHVLVPKGTRLLCRYDSATVRGQTRLVVGCSRLIMPNGESVDLTGAPGADLAGAIGLPGKVNRHLLATFGTTTLLAVISGGIQISQGTFERDGTDAREVMAGAVGQQLGQTANEILRRDLNRAPTIEVAAGTRFVAHLVEDLHFERAYRD
jgi:type IV secretory pathway VirB10-like protein